MGKNAPRTPRQRPGGAAAVSDGQTEAVKYATKDCADPDLTQVPSTVSLTLCDGTPANGSLDLSDLTPANIKSGVTIAGVVGTASLGAGNLCASDGESSCVVDGTNFKAVAAANIQASDIRAGVTIAGVTGSGAVEAHVNCNGNGAVGCVTTSVYKSADLTNLVAGNIKNGVMIAGTAGTYPSLSNPLSGATVMSDLTSLGASTAVGTYEFFDSAGRMPRLIFRRLPQLRVAPLTSGSNPTARASRLPYKQTRR